MDNPTFDKVRDLSTKFYRELPQALQDELFEALNRGIDILDTEPQMAAYLFAFGKMHQAKLSYAFGKLPKEFLEQPEINIIDYGCGQALGTMCYANILRENGYFQKVKTITLVEPSEICLKRAALHVSVFFPKAEIKTIQKEFDDLTQGDIICGEETPTLHILSNVLDMMSFDLVGFANLIKGHIKGYNQFVCVGPYFNYSNKDDRMDDFFSLMDGEENYCENLDKYELDPEKTWTAQILCFAVGVLEEGLLSMEITEEEINNDFEDSYGVLYSKDGKRLLKCNNPELETYSIKNGTVEICCQAFGSCSLLSQITIPDSVEKIDAQAFLACESLQQVVIPTSVTSIGWEAFSLCDSLQQIDIPNSVTSIGAAAFFRCTSLLRIVIPDSITRIDYQTFSECDSLQQIIISNSVKIIGDWAFSECKSLKQISIPNTITYIGVGAFAQCVSLEQVVLPDTIHIIGDSAFEACESLRQITIPDSVSCIGNGTFWGCKALQQINIPDLVTSIGHEVFDGCKSLRQITIPNSVTSIGDMAFRGTGLVNLFIPNSVTNIKGAAFFQCESLKQIIIPNSVKSIGHEAFMKCLSLQEIVIPDSVTSIEECAFLDCSSLERITIPKGSKEKFKTMLDEKLWDILN